MKLNRIASFLSVSIASLAVVASAQADLKIGIIDMKKAFEEYNKTKVEEAKIEASRTQARKEFEDLRAPFAKGVEEFRKLQEEANKPELTKAAKEEKGKQLQSKGMALQAEEKKLQEFQADREKFLNEQQVRSRNAIVEDIQKVIDAKAKAAGYDIIFDKSGQSLNAVGTVVFSKEQFDFTQEVITELNSSTPPPAGGTGGGTGTKPTGPKPKLR